MQGDVIGVGYRPRTGTIFFTRNGKKLDDVVHGIKTLNLFPTLGANGPCSVHVNFGQLGFVFIEANVKKWGLAPMTGSLAPPPPYGSEQGSILLETGQRGLPPSDYFEAQSSQDPRRTHGRNLSLPPTSPGPARSPTDISLTNIEVVDESQEHQHHTQHNPPPYTTSHPAASDSDSTSDSDTPSSRLQDRARLLGVSRSPTPAYGDIIRTRSPGTGRYRSGSAPAGPSGTPRP